MWFALRIALGATVGTALGGFVIAVIRNVVGFALGIILFLIAVAIIC